MILNMHAFPASWIQPDWPAPHKVRAIMTTREGGVSDSPWDSMNVGDHVGDVPSNVQINRARLADQVRKPTVYLQQVHGASVLRLTPDTAHGAQVDGCWTSSSELACTIMVADCLPVLLCDVSGRWVAAAHAGWRGLAGVQGQGILESLVSCLPISGGDPSGVMAWLGPCIGPQAFEVGQEVRAAFDDGSPEVNALFTPLAGGKFLADLAGLARKRLLDLGVQQIYGNNSQPPWCTASQPALFFSHRRDSRVLGQTGRMAACIWLDA